MQPLTLLRAAELQLVGDGRTITGGMAFDEPVPVSDPGTDPYLESFDPRAFDRTISMHPDGWPVFDTHAWRKGGSPIGMGKLEPGPARLRFFMALHDTADARDVATKVRDGSMRSMSIAFRAIRDRKISSARGIVTHRLEVAVREISLVATGFGAHPSALVDSVRSARLLDRETRARSELDVYRNLARVGEVAPEELARKERAFRREFPSERERQRRKVEEILTRVERAKNQQ